MDARPCWEFNDCTTAMRQDCPAFRRGRGRECWYFAGSHDGALPGYCEVAHGRRCATCPFFATVERDERGEDLDSV